MPKQVQITFDARDPHDLADWWAARLELAVEDHSDVVEGLLADGVITDDDVVRHDDRVGFADAAAAHDPDGVAPRLYFQRAPEARTGDQRLHLDVPVDQERLDAEVDEWVGVGATFVRFGSHPGHRWAVMRDPEGNVFCLH